MRVSNGMQKSSYFGLSGVPSPLQYVQDVAKQAPQRSVDALNDTTQWLTAEVRERAMRSPAWAPLVDDIEVRINAQAGTFQLGVFGDRAQEADELEHGSDSTPPQPFLRTTMMQLAGPVALRLRQAMRV